MVFVSVQRHKISDFSKKALKLMRKYAKTHEPVTWEHRVGRDVPLSEVSLPFRASVEAFSKKRGVSRNLRRTLIGLVRLIRQCLRYHVMFIVFVSVQRHKNSDDSKKALKLMRKYAKIHEHMTWEHRLGRDVPLSEVSLPFCASVQGFSKKCGIFRALRCVLIGLAGLIR